MAGTTTYVESLICSDDRSSGSSNKLELTLVSFILCIVAARIEVAESVDLLVRNSISSLFRHTKIEKSIS